MLKFYEFKINGIKKRKRLKKLKKNDLNNVERRRQEIIDKHSVFVAGASGFAEGLDNLSEKKHLNLEVKLTPEWILDKFSLSRYADDKGVIYFYSDEENCHWLELALETLGIPIIKDEIVLDLKGTSVFSYELLLDELMNKCPSLYQEMWELHVKECLGE
jgi:hypothetical protein